MIPQRLREVIDSQFCVTSVCSSSVPTSHVKPANIAITFNEVFVGRAVHYPTAAAAATPAAPAAPRTYVTRRRCTKEPGGSGSGSRMMN